MRLVPTFNSVSIYIPGNFANQVTAKIGNGSFLPVRNLWYNGTETVGSLLKVPEDTTVEVRVGGDTQTTRTWGAFPIGETRTMPSNGLITSGGDPDGWILYDATGMTLRDIEVSAPYVMLVNGVGRGASGHGLSLIRSVHHVLIDGFDIANFGPSGMNFSQAIGGIGSDGSAVSQIIVQRCKIHEPNGGSLAWDQGGHPGGPVGVQIKDSNGNNVFRWNHIYSSDDRQHDYKDGLRGGTNASDNGFPGPDSDIYGNIISHIKDDCIEVEGGGQNVRVWENYGDQFFTFIACTPVQLGPLYVFRNVSDRARRNFNTEDSDAFDGGPFAKCGDGRGRAFFFHNVALQREAPGKRLKLGVRGGVMGTGGDVFNHYARNNIFQSHDTRGRIYTKGNSDCSYDYNTIVGVVGDPGHPAESHGEVRSAYVPLTFSFDGTVLEAEAIVEGAVEDVGLGLSKGLDGPIEVGVSAYEITVLPPTCTIQARTRAKWVFVTWESEGAESAFLNGQPVEPNGTIRELLVAGKTYTISVANTSGACSSSVTVRGSLVE